MYQEVLIGREVFTFKYKLNSHVLKDDFNYTLQLFNWTEHIITIKINFEDIQKVSIAQILDQVYLEAIDTSLFVSHSTGLELSSDYVIAPHDVPRQIFMSIEDELKADYIFIVSCMVLIATICMS